MKNPALVLLIALLLVSSCNRLGRYEDLSKVQFEEMKFRTLPTDDLIEAEGHWVQTAGRPGLGHPVINSASIVCLKREAVCTEILAHLGSTLDVDRRGPSRMLIPIQRTYKILSWARGSVFARSEMPVGNLDLKINSQDHLVEFAYRETKANGSRSADPSVFASYSMR